MFCPNCQAQLPDDAQFCGSCGGRVAPQAVVATQATMQSGQLMYQAPAQQPVEQHQAPGQHQGSQQVDRMSKDEFTNLPAMGKIRADIRVSAIICYICAGITAVVAIIASPLSLIDAVLLVGLGLLIHLKKSFGAAIALLVYALVNIAYLMATTGAPGGLLILIAGVYSTMQANKLRAAWNEYQKTGVAPTA